MTAVVSEKGYNLTTDDVKGFTNGIVFVDPTVENYQSLIAGVVAGTEVVVLDTRHDGIKQISQVLAGRQDLSSLHILSHGRPGSVQLGTVQLGLDTLNQYASQLQGWTEALANEANILLYGCQVAAGREGTEFVQHLSRLTGVAVTASTNKTGCAVLGGSWDLEFTTGRTKVPLALQPEVMAAYGFVLSTTRVSVASNGTQGNDDSFRPSISANGRYVVFGSEADNLVSGDTNDIDDIFIHDRQTGITQRVSIASDGTQGENESFNPSVSEDGRFVAFTSFADNLVSGDTNDVGDIFVHDRQTGITQRVSVNSNGVQANSDSATASISEDGRFVAFASVASNLVPGDTNDDEGGRIFGNDIFVYDRQTGITQRVSVNSNGVQANNDSASPFISADGRYVAFVSDADNLVSGDTNDEADVFVHDRQTNITTRVSVASDGTEADDSSFEAFPSISADGRYVAFASDADNLVSDDTNDEADIFVRDRQTGITRRVSVASDGTQAENDSFNPSISANGRYVTFASSADNLVSDDTNEEEDEEDDIFVYDLQQGTIRRVSVASDGTQAESNSFNPSISRDGRDVAFGSSADNLVSNDTNDEEDVFVFDGGGGSNVDFNSDGDSDILWRNGATGENAIWLMDGTTLDQSVLTTPVTNLDWSIGGAGDFNNDGNSDILWRDSVTGENAIWLMDGTTLDQSVLTTPVTNLDWSIGGSGDFNNDGNSDILWRDEVTGQNAIWLMDGTTLDQSVLTTPVTNLDWSIGGSGDFNNDGDSDILWRDSVTGENAIWLMNGTTLDQSVLTTPVTNLDWSIGGSGDFNNDGDSDILWRDSVTGENAIWLMNGTTLDQSVLTTPITNLDWQIGA